MPEAFCLFVDDSGTRHPDRRPGGDSAAFGGWFGLGGLLIREADIEAADARIDAFRLPWNRFTTAPLHSYDIRQRTGEFSWLSQVGRDQKAQFMADISSVINDLPIQVLACVVDRDGYNARYTIPYGRERWKLCKTAFSILLERSVKLARHHDAKLRVYLERSDKATDKEMKRYYESVRLEGLPFDAGRSAQYSPLKPEDFRSTLYEFRLKDKQSKLMQMADMVLWPLCRNGYVKSDPSFEVLRLAGKLVEVHCTPENGLQGTKYSCFESVTRA